MDKSHLTRVRTRFKSTRTSCTSSKKCVHLTKCTPTSSPFLRSPADCRRRRTTATPPPDSGRLARFSTSAAGGWFAWMSGAPAAGGGGGRAVWAGRRRPWLLRRPTTGSCVTASLLCWRRRWRWACSGSGRSWPAAGSSSRSRVNRALSFASSVELVSSTNKDSFLVFEWWIFTRVSVSILSTSDGLLACLVWVVFLVNVGYSKGLLFHDLWSIISNTQATWGMILMVQNQFSWIVFWMVGIGSWNVVTLQGWAELDFFFSKRWRNHISCILDN